MNQTASMPWTVSIALLTLFGPNSGWAEEPAISRLPQIGQQKSRNVEFASYKGEPEQASPDGNLAHSAESSAADSPSSETHQSVAHHTRRWDYRDRNSYSDKIIQTPESTITFDTGGIESDSAGGALTHSQTVHAPIFDSDVQQAQRWVDPVPGMNHVVIENSVSELADEPQREFLPPGAKLPAKGLDPFCGVCSHRDHCGWMLTFGVEETFLVPDSDGVFATAMVTTPADVFSGFTDAEMQFGPRIWFGIDKYHWQILGRVWVLGGTAGNDDPLLIGTGDTRGSIIDSDLDAFTVDAEVRRVFYCCQGWDYYFGFGFRHAALEDTARVTLTGADTTTVNPSIVHVDALAWNDVQGSGFTVPFGGNKPIHYGCCSRLDFFWNARASILWGDINTSAQSVITVFDPNTPGVATRFDSATAQTDDDLIISEFQTGIRWTHQLKCMPAVASIHCAFEYQWWDSDGGTALVENAAAVNANGATASAVAGPNVELSLIGLAIGAGLTW